MLAEELRVTVAHTPQSKFLASLLTSFSLGFGESIPYYSDCATDYLNSTNTHTLSLNIWRYITVPLSRFQSIIYGCSTLADMTAASVHSDVSLATVS